MANSDRELEELLRPKVPPKGYLFLLIGIVMFSGVFARATGPIRVLDYTTILGEFGTIAKDAGAGFRGKGGVGVREGFVFAFTALPAVALAIGLINIIEGQGGLKAAQRLLNPILKPLLGIPGWTGLALMGNLQNTDTGAVLTKSLLDRNLITDNELSIFSAFQLPASAIIGMYFSTGVLLFPYFPADKALGSVMAMWKLPGEAGAVLVASWLSSSGGIGATVALIQAGKVTGLQAWIMLPMILLIGGQIQMMSRILAVAGTNKKHYLPIFGIGLIDMILCGFVMALLA